MTSDRSGWIGQWSPGIGDPTFAGWFTVAAYGASVVLCFSACRTSARQRRPAKESLSWCLLTAFMLALGINKQLDLQTALTEMGRSFSRDQGWYEQRRAVQFVFVAAVALGAMGAALWLWRQARVTSAPLRRAVMGATVLAGFVVIRAASFHHIDLLLALGIPGVRFNVLLEVLGILWVSWGAWTSRTNKL